jgi:hypothetical protein
VPTTLLAYGESRWRSAFSGPAIANATVSNVPGRRSDFFAGARLLQVTGLGPRSADELFHIVASHNGTVSIGDLIAVRFDPGHYADCMQSAFQEMLSAAA